jgi:hypothetical protein
VRPGSPSWPPNVTITPNSTASSVETMPAVTRSASRPVSQTNRNTDNLQLEAPSPPGAPADSNQKQPTTTYPSTGVPPAAMPIAPTGPLPQVQTGEPPAAFATLRGVVVPPVQTR